MAIIRDIMPAFELFQPATTEDALGLLDRYGSRAWVLAGGLDSFDWLKDRIKRPEFVIDLSQVKELRGIKPLDGGIEIGAMTTLTEVVRDPVVREKFSILSEGAEAAASPADPQSGHHRRQRLAGRALLVLSRRLEMLSRRRQHLLRRYAYRHQPRARHLGRRPLRRRQPSDTAPALIALDAKMVIRSSKGERVVDAEDYFIGPAIDITRMTVLQPGELLTAIRIPSTWAGAHFYFEKIRDRQVWDFPLVNIASAAIMTGEHIDKHPHRDERSGRPSHAPERGGSRRHRQRSQRRHRRYGGSDGSSGRVPLRYNGYKVPLTRNLVKRAIRGVEEPKWAS
jgi:xanthine dehydrogenase YagS FAD-binding subunit